MPPLLCSHFTSTGVNCKTMKISMGGYNLHKCGPGKLLHSNASSRGLYCPSLKRQARKCALPCWFSCWISRFVAVQEREMLGYGVCIPCRRNAPFFRPNFQRGAPALSSWHYPRRPAANVFSQRGSNRRQLTKYTR